jgi:glutathione peroxidase
MTHATVHAFSAKDITGKEVSLSQWQGKYLLVVNVASQCGFTPQYKGLQNLQNEMADKLVVLGFPCNQFGGQEPADEGTIQTFCERNFGVTFPLFAKVDVNGDHAHPLYRFLKGERPGVLGTEAIKWNFTKFLVGRNGEVLKRYAPTDAPEKIQQDLKALP